MTDRETAATVRDLAEAAAHALAAEQEGLSAACARAASIALGAEAPVGVSVGSAPHKTEDGPDGTTVTTPRLGVWLRIESSVAAIGAIEAQLREAAAQIVVPKYGSMTGAVLYVKVA